jgi:hypothetical protein
MASDSENVLVAELFKFGRGPKGRWILPHCQCVASLGTAELEKFGHGACHHLLRPGSFISGSIGTERCVEFKSDLAGR